MTKNVLILYTNYGTGHYMAAKAIEEYIKDNYKDYFVQVLDPLSFSRPIINKLFAKIGKIAATKFRRFRGNLYKKKMYQNYLKNSHFFMFCTRLFWTKKLNKKLVDFNPNIIISTQVGPTGLIAAHKNLFNVKLISVLTDYGLHRMYTVAHEFVDIFCVPDKNIKQQMIDIGINENKIEVTGIPVRSSFLNNSTSDKSEFISKYKLLKNKPVFLFICGGGLGYDNAFSYFKQILQTNYEFSYIFISGKNNSLFKKANSFAAKYNKKGKVFGYVENIDEFIRNSDLVFGKPGGIVTSEALNLNVPLCAIEPIPGQEVNNSLFIANNKFGFYITNMKEFECFLENLKNNKINLNDYKENINRKFTKFSFLDIGKF